MAKIKKINYSDILHLKKLISVVCSDKDSHFWAQYALTHKKKRKRNIIKKHLNFVMCKVKVLYFLLYVI